MNTSVVMSEVTELLPNITLAAYYTNYSELSRNLTRSLDSYNFGLNTDFNVDKL